MFQGFKVYPLVNVQGYTRALTHVQPFGLNFVADGATKRGG